MIFPQEHGGQVTDDEAAADVILTRSRDEYKYLKDRYAVSRKTHVRMSGFVDRCIDANWFVLEPVLGKGVLRGRKPGARRTEFTEDDDEHLCQYIAEVLPEKGEGGRAGHFIYTDLMWRADQFGKYNWAQRYTQDSWCERYRKNQVRLDRRITEIVKENPPAPDGKGGTSPGESESLILMMLKNSSWMPRQTQTQNRRPTMTTTRFWPRKRVLSHKKKRKRKEGKNTQHGTSQTMNTTHAMRTTTKRRKKDKKCRMQNAGQHQPQPRAVKRLGAKVPH
ncbi:hypothetical protein EI94DRAFT_1152211 [Lactarius quietus]|nr:hypothetical protein EI94DRAFT_1152211 [Lactarius quietus]